PCSQFPCFERLGFGCIFALRKRNCLSDSEFCVFSGNAAETQVLAASKLFNHAARFFWFVFLTRQKNEQAWSEKKN
ncbi:MAG: hypothetical protein R3302_04630, partial [Sulfurimonadaceae bacterium]|nr:hypothetical protein [Sulfurimonadaceae bacterium]